MQLPGIKMCTALCIVIIRGTQSERMHLSQENYLTSNNYTYIEADQEDIEWLH